MWMIGAKGIAKELGGEVGVNFCGGETLVAEHFLHSTQVGTILYEFGGKTMSEAVGGDVFA